MNVQLILVQAGIELARLVLESPITRRLLVEALCKITTGGLCSHVDMSDSKEAAKHFNRLFTQKGEWRKKGGVEPQLILQASDSNGDETTLTCGVEFAQQSSWSYKFNEMDKLMAEVRGEIPPDYAKLVTWLNKDTGTGDGISSSVSAPWISWDDFRLETLDSFEQFLETELFKTSKSS